jgi:sulfur carrier protein
LTIKIKIDIELINSELQDKQLNVPNRSTYEDVLDILGINQETVLILKGKKAIPIDGIVVPGKLTIMCIASQG